MRSLAETQRLAKLARALYPWLLGSNPPYGRAFTLRDAAAEVGLAGDWRGGSKLPALEYLLEFAFDGAKLGRLVQTIVREGIKYRARKGPAVTRDELEAIGTMMTGLGLSPSEIVEPALLSNFERGTAERTRFREAMDRAIAARYPRRPDGRVLFPFLRRFVVAVRAPSR